MRSPGCSTLLHRPIDWIAFLQQVSAGAALVKAGSSDPQPPYPEQVVEGPVWTPDDLLDVNVLLDTLDWLGELESAGTREDSGCPWLQD